MNYQSKKYEEIGNEIINSLFPQLLNVRIAWLGSDKEKCASGKVVYAECAKVSAQYDWCCPYDFIITVYEPNAGRFDEEQLKILLEHELMHIGIDGERKFIVPHDVEEFRKIIDKYGMDWSISDDLRLDELNIPNEPD